MNIHIRARFNPENGIIYYYLRNRYIGVSWVTRGVFHKCSLLTEFCKDNNL